MPPIAIHSIYIGQPQTITDEHGTWRSSIFRSAVSGHISLGVRGHEGDQVTDTRHHGQPNQAVCCHAMAHYDFWNSQLNLELVPGNVGENWTLLDAEEAEICIHDIYQVGTAQIQVSGPRVPCSKQARRVGHKDWVSLTLHELRTGFYLSVLEPGVVHAGDAWLLVDRPYPDISLTRMNRSAYHRHDPHLAEQVREIADMDTYWREKLS